MENDKILRKKRIIQPLILNIIDKLMVMAKDAATLEYVDNDQASRRLKMGFVSLRDNEFDALHKNILSIREEINSKYNQSKSKKNRNDEYTETV